MKKKIWIFCSKCQYHRQHEGLVRLCPECQAKDLSIVSDSRLHRLCKLWAMSTGWDPGSTDFNLPTWVIKDNLVAEWRKYEETLINPEKIGPPPDFSTAQSAFVYFLKQTILKQGLWSGNLDQLLNAYPILHRLALTYIKHWKDELQVREESGRAKNPDEIEKKVKEACKKHGGAFTLIHW